jgi:hypothetical protein
MKTIKPFDCVEMKRKAAEKIYRHIKDMTPDQELAYWNNKAEKQGTLQVKETCVHEYKARLNQRRHRHQTV